MDVEVGNGAGLAEGLAEGLVAVCLPGLKGFVTPTMPLAVECLGFFGRARKFVNESSETAHRRESS